MLPIGRKVAVLLAAACGAVLLAQPMLATASETEGGNGSGTFTETSFAGPPTVTTAADGSTRISQTTVGTYTGTLAGTFTEPIAIVIFADGTLAFSGFERCVCAVAGRSGTFADRLEGTGSLPAFKGRVTVIRGTGELSKLHATLKISGTVNLTTGLASGQYFIHYDFDD